MIFYLLLICMQPPQPTTKPGDCFVVGASRDHDKTVEMAHEWCQEEDRCLEKTYMQQVVVETDLEKIK